MEKINQTKEEYVMGLKEWNDRVNENYARDMTYMEASFATPLSIFPEFMKSSKKPDTRAAIYTTGLITGMMTMAAVNAGIRGHIGLAIFYAVVGAAPVTFHTWRGKKILAAQPQTPEVS